MLQIVEDLPAGYPRYSALIASETPFGIYRRFRHVRHRRLLELQDRIVVLEYQLEQTDDLEIAPLRLAKLRADTNQERRHLMEELDRTLETYGSQPWPPVSHLPASP